MYQTVCANPKCPNPTKVLFVYATSRSGQIPTAYCSKKCEYEARYDERHT